MQNYFHLQVIKSGQGRNKFFQSIASSVVSPGFWQRNFLQYDGDTFKEKRLSLHQTCYNPPNYTVSIRSWNSASNGFVPVFFIHKMFFGTHTNGQWWNRPVSYDIKYSEKSWNLAITTCWEWSIDKRHWNVLQQPKPM